MGYLEPLIYSASNYLKWIYNCWKSELSNNIPYTIKTVNNLKIPIGETLKDTIYYEPLKVPHVLVGGCTGSGKSVFIKSLLTSIISNINCDIYCIDLKIVELARLRIANK